MNIPQTALCHWTAWRWVICSTIGTLVAYAWQC